MEPAVKTLGAERVYRVLLDRLCNGTDADKAGAASARYWVRVDELLLRGPVVAAFDEALLREFVGNPNLDVRRRILPLLPLRAKDWPPTTWPLVEQAVAIARAHPDEHIHHCVEVQLGAGGPYKPIPNAATCR